MREREAATRASNETKAIRRATAPCEDVAGTQQHMIAQQLRALRRRFAFVVFSFLCATVTTVPLAAQLRAPMRDTAVAPHHGERGRARLKLNASALIGIPGIAYERALTDRTSFNIDATASLWRSVRGAPFQFLTIIPEWQIHSRRERLGYYAGIHLGASVYRLQKWNYWGTRLYQEGYSTLLGATIGYKSKLTESLILDAFVGGGSQHGRYRGYDGATGEVYAGADRLDESREWLPYRAGIMIGYHLR